MEKLTQSKIGVKRANLKINKTHTYSSVIQINAGCSKRGDETEQDEFNVSFSTDETLYYLKLTPKDAARIALFWMQYLPEHLKES